GLNTVGEAGSSSVLEIVDCCACPESSDADPAVIADREEAVGAEIGPVAESVTGYTPGVGGGHGGDHGTNTLVLGIAETLAGSDHRCSSIDTGSGDNYIQDNVLDSRPVPGHIAGFDAIIEAVGEGVEVVHSGGCTGCSDADLAVDCNGIEAVKAGAGVAIAEVVACDSPGIGGGHSGDHGTGNLVLGVAETLTGRDHRGGLVHIGDVKSDILGSRPMASRIPSLDDVSKAVWCRLEVVLGHTSSYSGSGNADLAVIGYSVESVCAG